MGVYPLGDVIGTRESWNPSPCEFAALRVQGARETVLSWRVYGSDVPREIADVLMVLTEAVSTLLVAERKRERSGG